jgi:hypothetical protein
MEIDATEMVVEVIIDNAIMFKPVGAEIKVPRFIRRGTKVYILMCVDLDGRACYRLR